MKNKKVTIYELLGLIKDGKAPKEIKINNKVFEWAGKNYIGGNCFLLSFISIENEIDIPNLKVEILSEEDEMKKMVYQKDRKTELLYSGTYKGYDFYIMNLGTHPTAYVNVCNNKLLNGKNWDKLDIDVHGGLTYSADHLYINAIKEVKGWFIGWDYAHYNDYAGYEMDMPENLRSNGKKWTTEEIYEDVKKVIEQCINYKENDEWEDIDEIELELRGDCKYAYASKNYTSYEFPKEIADTINQLIKNQKYLKERLDKYDRED